MKDLDPMLYEYLKAPVTSTRRRAVTAWVMLGIVVLGVAWVVFG